MSATRRRRRGQAPACTHPSSTTSPAHQRAARGRVCNHDELCDACGVVVASESWNLSLGRQAHAAAYPPRRRPSCK